jgi:hypothetical protein
VSEFKQPNLLFGFAVVVALVFAAMFGYKWWADRRYERRQADKEAELSRGTQLPSAYPDLDVGLRLKIRGNEVFLAGHIENSGELDVAAATYEVRCIPGGTHRVELGAWPAGEHGDYDEYLFTAPAGLMLNCEDGLFSLDMGR